jgi:hypothetical protein
VSGGCFTLVYMCSGSWSSFISTSFRWPVRLQSPQGVDSGLSNFLQFSHPQSFRRSVGIPGGGGAIWGRARFPFTSRRVLCFPCPVPCASSDGSRVFSSLASHYFFLTHLIHLPMIRILDSRILIPGSKLVDNLARKTVITRFEMRF